ncbi:L,D-transpeptidase family protein [uncultured Psychrosphaera sp.]|uniref:L,D-transpeptidase family protein n=1 Tax=uncultured Psychrosphaera sp. TaxID=1403522 RepID=UPI002624BADD|nr:L,D-transpeptidase family protein [uncultured Psychrosphaera sp.]
MKKVLVLVAVVFLFLIYQYGRSLWYPIVIKFTGKATVAEVITKLEGQVSQELSPLFLSKGIHFPPKNLSLIAFKDSKELQVWASNEDEIFKLITRYDIKAASGVLGPKLIEGDKQVPEGLYKIEGFNPNSSYHLSMKLNYPNAFDLQHANKEGRSSPGTNIFIHGRSASVGCLAMGDPVIEKLFYLVHKTGISNTRVIISPTDPSLNELHAPSNSPEWVGKLYEEIVTQYNTVTKNRTALK